MSQNPEVGAVSSEYPYGYGYCQCGCGKKTMLLYNGSHAAFVSATHHPRYRNKDERTERLRNGRNAPTTAARERQSRIATEVFRARLCDGTFRAGRAIGGTYFSNKNDRHMVFMSSYERRAFEILDAVDSVRSYEEQPYAISYCYRGARLQYVPDAIVRFKDGRSALLEIKPRSQLTKEKIIAKAKAAISFCQRRGLQYMIWTEDLLRLQGFKCNPEWHQGCLSEYCNVGYIESVLVTKVEQIQRVLDCRREDVYRKHHPRA
jgi:hypothetical protein